MKLLITGGAGFIGTNCSIYFRKKGYEIINVDKLGIGSVRKNLDAVESRFFKIDISRRFPMELLEGVDYIVNLASESHVDRSIADPYFFFRNNVGLMLNLLEAMRKQGGNVKMVHVSTDEVYGDIVQGSFSEDSTLRPSSPYSASKASQDSFALAYSRTYGLDISITRCTNNYGPYQLPEKLIPKAIIRALNNMKIPLYGSGKQVRDWLFVEDHCRAIETVLRKGKRNEIYNVSAGNEKENFEVVRKILDIMGKPQGLIQFIQDRPGHDVRYSMKSAKLHMLGWKPAISPDSGLKRTVSWYIDNRKWWKGLTKFI